jgi:Leucine-rich repeat (LRR) protein
LSRLDLSNNNLKPCATAALTNFAHLNELRLGGNAGLTDADLMPIGTAHILKKLDLSSTKLTDVGLENLAGNNPCLEDLNISGTFTLVDPSSSAAIAKLANLTTLNIGSTGVRDATLRAIWKGGVFLKLVFLDISGTMVTDRGLATDPPHPDVGFRNLQSINIANTRVTLGGLNHRNALIALLPPLPPPTTTPPPPATALPPPIPPTFTPPPLTRVQAVTIPTR